MADKLPIPPRRYQGNIPPAPKRRAVISDLKQVPPPSPDAPIKRKRGRPKKIR